MKILKFNPNKSKAQAIVEFAIALPVLLLILYGLMETGRFLFIIQSVNNATRQAARYGSTSGVNPTTSVPRYQDCAGIRAAAQKGDFLNSFDDNDIVITYDHGTSPYTPFDTCNGNTDTGVTLVTGDRVTVSVNGDFKAVVPKLLPFISTTVPAVSSRTLLLSISIAPPVVKETTTTTITGPSSPSSSEINQPVTFNVSVTSTTTPTGSVVVKDTTNNVTLCTVTLSSGAATCPYTFTSLGVRTITAEYAGDSTHNASTGTLSHTVGKASVTITIFSTSPNPSAPNGQVKVTVNVTDFWGGPTPTGGTVTITGANTNCTINNYPTSNFCNVTFTSVGSKTLTASYGGDTLHKASNPNATINHTVLNLNDTTTTITSPASFTGQQPTFSGVVTPVGGTATGTVVVKKGSTTLCTATLSGTSWSCTSTVTLAPGPHNITATYTGNKNTSNASQTITVGGTSTVITAGTPSNGLVPITATVTGGSTTPTGTVAITGADTNCTITLSGGTGTCNVTFTSSVTNKTLTGTYSGDTTHAPSSGTTNVTVTVSSVISCAISGYALNSWSNGFNADVTIKNNGVSPINGWVLSWNFPNAQVINNMWNATYTQSGTAATATNMSYNATINPNGGTQAFGFGGTHTGTNQYPTNFKVNGTACTPPPVASCSTSTIYLDPLTRTGGTLNAIIKNNLPSAILIKDVTVTWDAEKGHASGTDLTAFLVSAKIGALTFWTGNDTDGVNIITPASPTFIPTGTSTMIFQFHQTLLRWGTPHESVSITLATPGCDTVVLYKNTN
jgi:Flp pilus assembly protein TadG